MPFSWPRKSASRETSLKSCARIRSNIKIIKSWEDEFHPFSKDESLLIRANNLSDPDIYARFQDFLLDLQFAPQVHTAFSIFSLPALTQKKGAEPAFFLTEFETTQLPIAERLKTLRDTIPLARQMLSEDDQATLVTLILRPDEAGDYHKLKPESYEAIQKLANSYSDAFKVSFVGIPQIQRTIRIMLNEDQTRLTIASTFLCLLVAWIIFRSWRGALICALPPVIGLIWYFGFLAIFDIPIDFLTTIVPTMVIVVAFADGLHLYLSIQRNRRRLEDLKTAVAQAIIRTGPACFLASLTTALAFVGIGLGGAETLHRLSATGAVGVMLAFASVILLVPALALLLLGSQPLAMTQPPAFLVFLGKPAFNLVRLFKRPVLILSVLMAIGLVYIHFTLPAGFRVSDYLSSDTPVRQDEIYIEKKLGGSGQLFAVLKDFDGKRGISTEDKAHFAAILSSLNKTITRPINAAPLLKLIDQLDGAKLKANHPLITRFINKDETAYLVPLPLGTIQAAHKISSYADAITEQLKRDGFEEDVTLAGLSLLTAKETPNLIRDLRTGLISAIVIVIGAIMIIVGSVRIGLACLLPNLVPILTVEAYFWFADRPINMTAVIALTIAFGIAVDNSIHLLNHYQLAKRGRSAEDGAQEEPAATHLEAMGKAISNVTPAVVSTTMLLIAGLAMTQISVLPSIGLFGRLIITALFVALLADLFMLPSFLLAFERKRK